MNIDDADAQHQQGRGVIREVATAVFDRAGEPKRLDDVAGARAGSGAAA